MVFIVYVPVRHVFSFYTLENTASLFLMFFLSPLPFFLLFHIFTAEQRGVFYTQNTPPAYAPGHGVSEEEEASLCLSDPILE